MIAEDPSETENEKRRDDDMRGEHVRLQRMVNDRELVGRTHEVLHDGEENTGERGQYNAYVKVENLSAVHLIT